jgi:hypothetical protein
MSQAVIVDRGVLDGQPIRAVSYLEPEHERDSGFAVFTQPPDATDDDGELVCLDCLIDEHPEIGRGLELARRQGQALAIENEWCAPS